jgi:A/G-specific adenine glycosylase
MSQPKQPANTLPNATFAKSLLRWYDAEKISLPWRGINDPYQIWLSEIMLQQTRVAAVKEYYKNWIEKFPTVEKLAAASLDEILKMWEGLGYYTRARNVHKLAKIIVADHQGKFPKSAEALQALPGIGRYTAAAIASISFDERVAVLDGNVIRILSRLLDLPDETHQAKIQARLWMVAESLLPKKRCGDFNQAMMDLGRTICIPRTPKCAACPVRKFCLAEKNKTTDLRPVKKAKAKIPNVYAAAAVLRDQQERILLVQRPPEGLLGGLWMLPQFKCEKEESFQESLQREFQIEFAAEIFVGEEMARAAQTFTHFHLQLFAYACEIRAGKIKSKLKIAWANSAELNEYSFGKADREIIDALESWQPLLFE